MDSSRVARWIGRAAPFAAAALLLPHVGWFGSARYGVAEAREGNLEYAFYSLGGVLLEGVALAAALCLLFRRTRGFGAVAGLVVLIEPATRIATHFAAPGLRWAAYDGGGLLWLVPTAALLLVVVGQERWTPLRLPPPAPRASRVRRPPPRTALDVVPAATPYVAGGALLWLALVKMQTMALYHCPDRWASANETMTSAETTIGLLTVFPRTRLVGATLGSLLMEGTALFGVFASLTGISPEGCHCFGAFDAPWGVHVGVALLLAAAFVAALIREVRVRAARPAFAAVEEGSIFTDVRSFLQRRRADGARHPWAAPVVGAVMLGCALPHVTDAYEAAARLVVELSPPSWDGLPWMALGAAEVLAGLWLLLRPRRRVVAAAAAFVAAAVEGESAVEGLVKWLGETHEPYFADWNPMPWMSVATLSAAALIALLATRRNVRRSATPASCGRRDALSPETAALLRARAP